MASMGGIILSLGSCCSATLQGARSFGVLVGPKRGESNIAHQVRNGRIPPLRLLKIGERLGVLFLARLRGAEIVVGIAQDRRTVAAQRSRRLLSAAP